MLPIESWFAALTLESGLPPRPTSSASHPHAGLRLLRRTVGRGLIALGLALTGSDAVGSRTVSVSR
jgi:hypothetical protein